MKKKLEKVVEEYEYVTDYQVDVIEEKVDVPVKYLDVIALMVFS